LFLGWFGPRGLASILFALLIVEASSLNNRELITNVAFVTVAISIVIHGISAAPATGRFPAVADDSPRGPEESPT
jgi:NhaP-type Na+/H+ or K+/H+ antiporter